MRPDRGGPHQEIRKPGSHGGQGGKNRFPFVGSIPESNERSGFTEGILLFAKLLLLPIQIQKPAILQQPHGVQALLKLFSGLAWWHRAVSILFGRVAPDPFALVACQW